MDFTDKDTNKSDSVVKIRSYEGATDAPIIYSTWRNSLWYDQKRDESLADQFYQLATREIRALLSLPTTHVRIACLENDSNHIVGWAVLSDKTIEFAYVKADYRKQGVATLLTRGFDTVSQPMTKIGKSITKNKKLVVNDAR